MKLLRTLMELEVLDAKPKTGAKEIPLNKPGGWNINLLNDKVTPYEVAVEALRSVLGLSEGEAFKRMMAAHKGGWITVATFASQDVAETKAMRLENHCRNNSNYDHYRTMPGVPKYPNGPGQFKGPWPTSFEVMKAGD